MEVTFLHVIPAPEVQLIKVVPPRSSEDEDPMPKRKRRNVPVEEFEVDFSFLDELAEMEIMPGFAMYDIDSPLESQSSGN